MKRLIIALAALLVAAGAWAATITPFPHNPNAVLIVADGTAYLVVDGQPIISWAVDDPQPDPQPDPTPEPSKVSGILILEEQADRTAAQAEIMDDPVWQTAAVVKGLKWSIEDDDHPSVSAHLDAAGSERPCVCLIDSDGKVVETRSFPATVDAMRELIGGVK